MIHMMHLCPRAQFVGLATGLLQCTERKDVPTNHLRVAAYEALNSLISSSALDTREHIKQVLPLIITRLEQSFQMQIVNNEDREAQNELQGLLCGVLQVITVKLETLEQPFCDQMMGLFLQVFGSKNQTVHEEALMAVGAIANGDPPPTSPPLPLTSPSLPPPHSTLHDPPHSHRTSPEAPRGARVGGVRVGGVRTP